MKKKDIVMFALPRWDGRFHSTALSLSIELSKENRVFYIDNPFTLKYTIVNFFSMSIRKRWKALLFGTSRYRLIDPANNNLINVTPMIIFPINFLPPGRIYNFFSKVNDAIVRRVLFKTIADYNVSAFIFINSYNPFFFQDLGSLRPVCKIYHCVDNISESNYVAKHGRMLEEKMIRTSDLTLTTSKRLTEYARQISDHVFYLPNAADFLLFQKALDPSLQRPAEISMVHQKVIGYIGNVDFRVDYEILKEIVSIYKDYVLLLVGPVGPDFEKSGLRGMPNVISTGGKSLHELPAFVRFIDCGIIPFLKNNLTASIYPLKLNEYLAAGKPVVTTSFSPDLNDFQDVIRIAGTKKEFIASLEVEIGANNPQKQAERIQKARGNTWEVRVKEFWEIVKPFCRENN
jgi:teichuronic acid biosynthesis glycosyltransferase TuaH